VCCPIAFAIGRGVYRYWAVKTVKRRHIEEIFFNGELTWTEKLKGKKLGQLKKIPRKPGLN
jgi:hypothetical protein